MAFRDDNEALRARIRALESENERLEDEKTDAEEQLAEARQKKAEAPARAPATENADASRDERMKAFMRGEGGESIESILGISREDSDDGAAVRGVGRTPRLTCTEEGGRVVVRVRSATLRESFKTGWWFIPAAGLGGALLSLDFSIPWSVAFSVVSMVVAAAIMVSSPEWRLELAMKGRFRLFKNKRASLEGTMQDLSVRIRGSGDGPYHAEIGLLGLGEDPTSIGPLSQSDAYRLRDAMERVGKKRTM